MQCDVTCIQFDAMQRSAIYSRRRAQRRCNATLVDCPFVFPDVCLSVARDQHEDILQE